MPSFDDRCRQILSRALPCAALFASLSAGCGGDAAPAASVASAAQPLSTDGADSQATVASLKAQIRAIAVANMFRTDNFDAVTAELTPLVASLVQVAPPLSPTAELDQLEGTWRNLWSNLGYGAFTPKLDRIYQVVDRDGHYYNISEQEVAFGAGAPPSTVVNALRGAYVPVPAASAIWPPFGRPVGAYAIRFTRNGFFAGNLDGLTSNEIAKIAARVESGAQPLQSPPPPPPPPAPASQACPTPPVGITGVLTTLYVDEALRIAGGSQTPAFDDDGNVCVPGQVGLLFVLERAP